jgi:hypothetical protein
LLIEGHIRTADNNGIDNIRLLEFYFVNNRIELRITEWVIIFANDFQPQLFNMVTGDFVCSTRPNIIRAKQVEGFCMFIFNYPINAGDYLLSSFLSGINNVWRLLKPFVKVG